MAPSKINNRRDILLLLLYSPGVMDEFNQPISGRTRIVKMLFLFREEVLREFRHGTDINEQNFYEFFAWDFGPFSTQVYDDLTFFTLRGFIETDESKEDPLPESAEEWDKWSREQPSLAVADEVEAYEEVTFRLTAKGQRFAQGLYDQLSPAQRQLLKTFKAKLVNAPLRAILRYVYSNYGSMTTKSKIKEDILGIHA